MNETFFVFRYKDICECLKTNEKYEKNANLRLFALFAFSFCFWKEELLVNSQKTRLVVCN